MVMLLVLNPAMGIKWLWFYFYILFSFEVTFCSVLFCYLILASISSFLIYNLDFEISHSIVFVNQLYISVAVTQHSIF